VLAGPVAGLPDRAAVVAFLASSSADGGSPGSSGSSDRPLPADLRYYLDRLAPLVDGTHVRWVGAVGGTDKDRLLRTARAVVFPLQWDEPGGTAIVESLLAGVPVVGYRRGCLPSLVEDGVDGFVCDDEDELVAALGRLDELDRRAIAARSRHRLSPARMAADYVRLYDEVIARAAAIRPHRGQDLSASTSTVAV